MLDLYLVILPIKNSEKIKQFYYRDRFLIIGITLFIHILIIVFSKFFITTLYGAKYIGAVPIFNILLIGSIIRFLGVYYTLYFNTNGKYKLQQFINILRAVLNVILDIIFIRLFGLLGPAIATTLAILITFVLSALYCEKRLLHLSKPLNKL